MKKRKLIGLILVMALFCAMALGSDSDTSSSSDKSMGVESTSKEESEKTETSIEEQVIFDAEGIKITAKEYAKDSILGDGIKVLIENTSDKDVGVGCDALMVNDFMITDLFSSTVAAGKSANETLNLSSAELEAAGIDSVGKIEVKFHLFDSETFMTTYTGETVEIKTSNAENLDETTNITGVEILNQDGIKIIGQSVDENSFWGAAVVLYIENSSGKNVIVQCDDCSINGFMTTPYFSSEVYDGKKAIDSIEFLSSELEENGIESIDEIELKIKVVDSESFSTIYETEPITITNK